VQTQGLGQQVGWDVTAIQHNKATLCRKIYTVVKTQVGRPLSVRKLNVWEI